VEMVQAFDFIYKFSAWVFLIPRFVLGALGVY
jgi:hypothetical protein